MSRWGSTTTTTETGGTYGQAQCSSPRANVQYRIGTDLFPDRMEEISMLGRDGDEDKGVTGRGRSGDGGTADNNNKDDDDHCNDGLRYVRLALSDTHIANKIPCSLLPPPPQPPQQRFIPGPWTHYFKVRKNLPNVFTLFYFLRHV